MRAHPLVWASADKGMTADMEAPAEKGLDQRRAPDA